MRRFGQICPDDWTFGRAYYSYLKAGLDFGSLYGVDCFEDRNVAHLKYPISDPFLGGLEMHTHLLTDRLLARGHDVTLFAAEGSVGGLVRTICLPTSGHEQDQASAQTICSIEHDAYSTIMRQIRNGKFDLVHCNALHYLPFQQSSLLTVPMVAVLHTPPFEPLEAAVQLAARHVTFIAVSSSLTRQWTGVSNILTVIYNGIDLTRFPYVSAPAAPCFAIWSGRIVPEKGLHLAIDAARIAGLPLKIAGPLIDTEYWRSHIEPRLGEDTTYLGHLTQSEIADVLGRASVLVCTPCWEEPFGLVVVEAMACGTPVAGFARGALPDLLDETSGVLVPADDIAALSRAILHCRKLDRRGCRSRAEDLFDCELMIDRYEALYERLLVRSTKIITDIGSELLDSADAV